MEEIEQAPADIRIGVRLLTMGDRIEVGTVKIAPFRVAPDVLLWRDRVFTYAKDQSSWPDRAAYVEAFAVVVLELGCDHYRGELGTAR